MHTSDYCLVVIVLFFALLLHSIRQEEKRAGDRRVGDLPGAAERRGAERRRPQSQFARTRWALKARWARWTSRR